jgi:hypothetical protein
MVLVTGGFDNANNTLASAELYDPVTGTSSATGSMNSPRVFHAAALLNNGKVLILGGQDSSGNALTSAELYDPAAGTFSTTGSLNFARQCHSHSPE